MAEPKPKKKRGGCLRMVAGIIFVAAIAIIAFALIVGNDNDDTTEQAQEEEAMHTLHGEVLIMNPRNFIVTGDTCRGAGTFVGIEEGATMSISTLGNDPVTAPLQRGEISNEGNCQLRFTIDLPEADSYIFNVGSHSDTRPGHAFGNTPLPEGWVEGGDPDDWWASIQYDSD